MKRWRYHRSRDEGEIGKLIGRIFFFGGGGKCRHSTIGPRTHERLALFRVIGGNWSGMESN